MERFLQATLMLTAALLFSSGAYADDRMGGYKNTQKRADSSAHLYSSIEPAAGNPQRVMRLDRQQVRSVQKALIINDYETGQIDGIFGVKTKGALFQFQRDRGLQATGMPTNETLAALGFGSEIRTERMEHMDMKRMDMDRMNMDERDMERMNREPNEAAY